MMSVSKGGIDGYRGKTLNMAEGGGEEAMTGRRSRRRRDGKLS